MTVSVYIHPIEAISEDVRKTINDEFSRIHNQKFMQRVNMQSPDFKGELLEMSHGVPFGCLDEHGFLDIPCHWDMPHGRETLGEIKKILEELGIKIKKESVG